MKPLIAGIVVIIVVAAGVGYAVSHKSNSSNPPTTSQTNSGSTQNSNQPIQSGAINIRNMMFTPSQITVQKGATVTWTNNDSVAHTVTDDLSNVGGPDSGDIQPGSTYSFKFTKAGSFQYHCNIHHSMRGTIVVK